jgi:hypothetical protein
MPKAMLGLLLLVAVGGVVRAQSETPLASLVVDDSAADLTGTWKASTSVKGFVGAGYQHASGPELHTATFKFTLATAGEHQLLVGYTIGSNRAKNAAVTITTVDGEQTLRLDQQTAPKGPMGLHALGKFNFAAGETKVVISTKDAQGVVIIDAVALLTPEQFARAEKEAPTKLAATPKPPAKEQKKEPAPPPEPAPPFARVAPKDPPAMLTPGQLDELLKKEVPELAGAKRVDDETFLRRVSLDIIGRNPTREEMQAFVADKATNKRPEMIDRLLASPQFGANWGSYWSDVIGYRVPEPELTFLNYKPFKAWLAEQLNKNVGWDEITYRILTAQGKVGEHPEATFVGFHQADKSRLASETTRVFLGTQIQCAECHDHKFIDLPQKTFHEFAAFFVRSSAKVAQNDSNLIEVGAKPSGEHAMPGQKEMLKPVAFEMAKVELGASDMARRAELARWCIAPDNPFFAKAYVNRVWARMMGRGFCEPVDEIGELADMVMPQVHVAVAGHFAASEFDPKSVYRLVANTEAYQRELNGDVKDAGRRLPKIITTRLRGDEVFESLVAAINLPNLTPPQAKATAAVRFPPPPKSTRDLVNEAYNYDPSLDASAVARTMLQAMFMMNNEQIQKQIDAKPGSATHLARLLEREKDDRAAIKALFEDVLARPATPSEVEIGIQHIAEVKDRTAAFEDLLWGLLNSAEFTTRR